MAHRRTEALPGAPLPPVRRRQSMGSAMVTTPSSLTRPGRRAEVSALRRRHGLPAVSRGQLLNANIQAVLLALLVIALWAASLWLTQVVSVSPSVRLGALFVHLVALVLGFGSVLAIDAYGLLWLVGRRSMGEVVRLAVSLDVLVWTGLAGLTLSGIFLAPDTAAPLARVKLVLVLMVGLNGVNLHRLRKRTQCLSSLLGSAEAPWSYLFWSTVSIAVSQLGWWGAIVIGFLTSRL